MFKKSFVAVLVIILVFSNLNLVSANENQTKKSVISKLEQINKLRKSKTTSLEKPTDKATFEASEEVRIIVEVEGKTPLEHANEQGVLYKELSESTKNSFRNQITSQQNAVKDAISSKRIAVNYQNNFKTSFNGFSGLVKFGDIKKIESTKGVKQVYLANEYNRPKITPDMDKSHQFIGSEQTWKVDGYKGEGMVVAVLDTGVDPDHQDFVLSEDTEEALTTDGVKALIAENSLKGKFFTEKVPFGYNYYDHNDTILDLGPGASEHGMHVAGTAVANGKIKGVAPEAQVLGMKVFSNDPNYPSTWSDVYLAAIDESIMLGADVLNMSLGSTASFYEANSPEDIAITRAVENGIVAAISAGNSGHVGYGWDNPFYQNPDIGVVGAPGLNTDSIQVAASGNEAYLYEHKFSVPGEDFEASGYGADDWTSLAELKGLEVVSLSKLNDGATVYGDTSDYEGVDVEGKVVLVSRGELSFNAKTENAAAAGAVGIIVYNNNPSATFYKDQGGWSIPFAMIHQKEGLALEKLFAEGPLSLKVEKLSEKESPEMGRLTDFSSWGTTPSLELKPEITAPGGNIYSTLQDNSYGSMSGTSMASPHVAGGSALVQQYLESDERFANLSAEARSRLAKALLMNTAEVIVDLQEQPFSPRRQGAGMMQLHDAVTTPLVVVDQQTDEAKVELKDFTSKTFTLNLTAENITDKAVSYEVDTSVLTDTLQKSSTVDYNALIAGDMEDAVVNAPKTIEVPAGKSIDFTVTVDISNAKIPGIDKSGNATTFELQKDIFVEGFVTLTDTSGEAAPLSVPYTGFYGEWDNPQVVDGFADLDEPAYYDLSSSGFTNMLYGESGNFTASVSKDDNTFYPISPNGDGYFDDIYPLPAFLRNATEMQFNILDANDKQLRTVLKQYDVRKTYYDAGNGSNYSFNADRSWDGTNDKRVVKDGLYYYEIKSKIDYKDADWQSKKIPVYLDTTAPSVEATYDAEAQKLSMEGKDSGTGLATYYVFVDGTLVNSYDASESSVDLTGKVNDDSIIEVAAEDNAANLGYSTVAVNDTERPVVFIDEEAPEPYGVYASNEVRVSGYVEENGMLDSITVNGESIDFTTTEDGTYAFETTVTFEKDDKYEIQVTATDVSGNEYGVSRKVFIDTTSPKISVDIPEFVDHDVKELTVPFTLEDNYHAISLTVGDDHVFEEPFSSPVSIMEPYKETVEHTISLESGNNTFVAKVEDFAGNTVEKEFSVYRNETEGRVDRLAGADRYETSAAISQSGWKSSDVVVLARGDDYVDALLATPLAKKYDAPLLLTEKDVLTEATKAEIERLGAKQVYVIGGEPSIKAGVVNTLTDLDLEVTRLAGNDRYETAAVIANEVAPDGANEAVIINSDDFPDALSVASYAAAQEMPILLTRKYVVPRATKNALYDLDVNKTLVIGGKSVISNFATSALPKSKRLSGGNRYETSVEIAKHFDVSTDKYFVATGKSFADALSGAALAAKKGTGILLVEDEVTSETADFLTSKGIELITVLGGKDIVSEDVVTQLNDILSND
ncbi:cell wall-binding repeat-containing protein [Paraliobacillus ryukyuensis]|nr:cell wall-binding repeat-containing protein [Paraliobacillus ryukyuensis]